jgi:hypothetical protein
MDTSTPAGKMVFTVLGAVAELERSLIVADTLPGVVGHIGRNRLSLDKRGSPEKLSTSRNFSGYANLSAAELRATQQRSLQDTSRC